jgi:hypothetical protein
VKKIFLCPWRSKNPLLEKCAARLRDQTRNTGGRYRGAVYDELNPQPCRRSPRPLAALAFGLPPSAYRLLPAPPQPNEPNPTRPKPLPLLQKPRFLPPNDFSYYPTNRTHRPAVASVPAFSIHPPFPSAAESP